MLSAQVDRLRKLADGIEERYGYPTAVAALREAADTIWELRGSVHRERAEADRLRKELEAVGIAAYSYGRGDLKAENAKLRTALRAVLQCNGITKRDKGCDACPMYDKEKEYVWAGDWCGIRKFIRELGIEVE